MTLPRLSIKCTVHRAAHLEFVGKVVHPCAPHAAAYITSMYMEDDVEIAMENVFVVRASALPHLIAASFAIAAIGSTPRQV